MDLRQQYLEAMGIQVWRLRRPELPPETSHASDPEAETEPRAAGALGDSPQPRQNLASAREPTPDPAQPPPPEAGDDPFAEYGQWAVLAEQAAEEDFFELPDEAPRQDPRIARIAALDWEGLRAEVAGCTACPLHATRTQAVFGVGNRQADWLIVGEAPGAEEDRRGEPFVGKAGKLLDAMLKALDLDRSTVFIGNVLKSRPPNNRDPTPDEIAACRPFLDRQIELVSPRVILVVGRIAAQTLLDTDVAVGRLRGRVHRYGPRGLPLVVTYHPAYLLRSPGEKRKVWADLQLARRSLDPEGKP